MSSIVVTTDLSVAARHALPVAQRLASSFGKPLLLLHVVHAPMLAPALAGSDEPDRQEAERALAELAAGLGGDVQTKVVTAEDVATGIGLAAKAAGAELLVIASHGRSGLERLSLGSVAEKVLATSETPVVCVSAVNDAPQPGSRIVVASDLTETSTRAFPVARRLAKALAMPLTLLVVDDPLQPRELADLKPHAELLGEGDPSGVTMELVQAPDTADGIVAQAQLDNAAFLCTAASPKSALRRLVLGSVSRKVMRAGAFPVVIVPATHGDR